MRKPPPSPLPPIRADGGSEFMADFGQACEEFGIVSPEAARALMAKSDAPVTSLTPTTETRIVASPAFVGMERSIERLRQ